MDRPSRKTKAVDYCESKGFDDDEDFAFAKAPPSKKSKEALKQSNNIESVSCEESNSQPLPSQKNRKPLDVKIYERDLEAAISLSLLNPPKETFSQSLAVEEDVIVQTAVDENIEPSVLHLSNCSVDGVCLGLDQITSDLTTSSKERKQTSDVQRNKPKAQDEDYQPRAASESESDNDYSEQESEDEEFTVQKKPPKVKKGQGNKVVKAKQSPSTTKQKKPPKSKSTVVSTPTRTPLTTKNASEPSRSVSLKATKEAACRSPGVSRVPKWNPPGQIGKSPSSSSGTPVRSPSQGLRLGLSRLVRVKPLHPSVASH